MPRLRRRAMPVTVLTDAATAERAAARKARQAERWAELDRAREWADRQAERVELDRRQGDLFGGVMIGVQMK